MSEFILVSFLGVRVLRYIVLGNLLYLIFVGIVFFRGMEGIVRVLGYGYFVGEM